MQVNFNYNNQNPYFGVMTLKPAALEELADRGFNNQKELNSIIALHANNPIDTIIDLEHVKNHKLFVAKLQKGKEEINMKENVFLKWLLGKTYFINFVSAKAKNMHLDMLRQTK